MSLFENRDDSGKQLAPKLLKYKGEADVIVLGLPRGGLPVARHVAEYLNAPLDVYIVRKLGVPGQEELAFGAIASGGERVLNDRIVQQMHVSEEKIEQVAKREEEEMQRRQKLYRGDRERPSFSGKTVILVDDGLATGASMRAAIQALRTRQPKKIVVAVPTAPVDTCEELSQLVDDIICLETPQPFGGVGAWYKHFPQTTDDEVRQILQDYNV